MTDLFITGPTKPEGEVSVSGAKNSATRLMCAALLTDEKVRLTNFPTRLVDVDRKLAAFRNCGVEVRIDHDVKELQIQAESLHTDGDTELRVRTTYLLAAGLIAKFGTARVAYPGGCVIGARGYDLHLMVWRKFGLEVIETESCIQLSGDLQGTTIDFPYSTVGGTENAILCGCVADGRTVIRNAYITPEVEDLVRMLQSMGACIAVFGNSRIEIEGRSGQLKATQYGVMPDRIEAITWIIYAAISGNGVTVRDLQLDDMKVPLIHLEEAGVELFYGRDSVYIPPTNSRAHAPIQPFELACGTHPGIISDMQPFFVLLGLIAEGGSRIFDYRYPDRVAYVEELKKFVDTNIEIRSGMIGVRGTSQFTAADVNSIDLRGSMAVIVAALIASGDSRVRNCEMALRGYNDLIEKLYGLGVVIERSKSDFANSSA